jgi:hypothetical protein
MIRARMRRALAPAIRLLDGAEKAPCETPSPSEECTRFPAFPWDLRTVILVFPPDTGLRFLNLNVTLGLTGVLFDQAQSWKGRDPRDAFDLQFCLEAGDKTVTYKQYHSIAAELSYRPNDVFFRLGDRLVFEGRWPEYRIRYAQPEKDFSIDFDLRSRRGFHWWAYSPGLYCHYTSFCDCRIEWSFGAAKGALGIPALHDHGWGKNALPLRLPLEVFRYEVMRLPWGAFALSLWTEGPLGMELKNVGLIREDSGPTLKMKRYECTVVEWEEVPNYMGILCRVPRRWVGTQRGEGIVFRYEAVRSTEPRAVLGEGFLYAFDYQGRFSGTTSFPSTVEGAGYVEQLGRLRSRRT